MGSNAHAPKIDKNCHPAYGAGVAYPKQKPDKVSKSAGISLPADMIKLSKLEAGKQGKTMSAVARELFKAWLEKTGQSLQAAAKPKLAKAKSSVKKRR
jgi:hypothetical protein